MFPPSFPISLALFFILAIANVTTDLAFVKETRRIAALRYPPFSHYTFAGDDYPPHLPLPDARKSISLTLEESTHYGLTDPNTNDEWTSMSPGGDGNIRLGPNHRFFNTGFSYQLHCAKIFVLFIQQDEAPTRFREVNHVSRCLNVLRQFALCSADTTLEPPDSFSRNFTAVRGGGDHMCRDSDALYRAMEQNWAEWQAFRKTLDA